MMVGFMLLMALILIIALFVQKPDIWRPMEYICCVVPMFAGEFASLKILFRSILGERDADGNLDLDYWGINGAGPEIIALAIHIPLYLILTIILERRYARILPETVKEQEENERKRKDSLVLNEEERVKKIMNGDLPMEQVVVNMLQKEFKVSSK